MSKRDSVIDLIKSSGVLIIANVAIKCIQFFLMPLYTRFLSPSELGVNDSIVQITALLIPFLTLALDASFSAFYFDKLSDNKDKIFNTISTIFIITSMIPVALCLISRQISLLIFHTNKYYLGVILSLISMSINLWFMPFALRMRMENRMKAFSLINVTASLTMVGSNILFVVVFRSGYIALILSQVVTNAVQLILYYLISRYRYKKSFFSKEYARKLIKYGLPLIPNSIFAWVLVACDRFMILHFCGESEVGLYGVGARFLTILNVIVNAVNLAYTTFAFSNKDNEYAKEMYAEIFSMLSFLLMGICFTLSVFAKPVIAIMTDSRYFASFVLIAPLLYSQTATACNNIVGYGISFSKKSKYFLYSSTIAAAVNIVLNYILVQKYGAYGASVATLIAHVVLFVFTFIISQKLYKVEYKVVRASVVFVATFFAATFVQSKPILAQIIVYVTGVITCLIVYRKDLRHTMSMFIKKS